MRNILAYAIVMSALQILPVAGQTASGDASVRFNLLTYEGLVVSDIFVFDQAYAEKHGAPVPAPFALKVPKDPSILRIADARPDGGALVKFTFGLEQDGHRTFLENLQIASATLPFYADREDPAETRIRAAVHLARDQIFPRAVAGFDAPKVLAVEQVVLGSVPDAVHLIASYTDPSVGPMLLRIVVLPHPRQEASLFVVSNINLTLVPVTDGATLARSLTGRVLASWDYR
ncbi:MAG: hypothetical protein ACK4GW_12190 [Pseudorhodobacter sp.]